MKNKGDVKINTRKYSNKQEKNVSKKLKGKKVVNSGATPFKKGDVVLHNWLIECKTTVKEKQSFSVKKEWLEKNEEEAFAMNKSYNSLCFNFGNDENYYIIDEKTFKRFIDLERNLENEKFGD